MSTPEPVPAPLLADEPSAARLRCAVDQLLGTADELARAHAGAGRLPTPVDRFVDAHRSLAEGRQDSGDPDAIDAALLFSDTPAAASTVEAPIPHSTAP